MTDQQTRSSETALTAKERDAVAAELTAQRAGVQRRLSALLGDFDEMVDLVQLATPDDEHDPDGTTAYDRAQIASLLGENRLRLADIERALAEVQTDDFGACSSCGRAIGVERLLAVAGTTQCASCAMKGR